MSGCPDCSRRASWRWWAIAGVVVVAAVLVAELVGCAPQVVTIGALKPTPRISLPADAGRLALDLGQTADTLKIDVDGLPPIEVQSFRHTLQTGFGRGLGRAFSPADPRTPELTLSLEVTELGFVDRRHADGTAGEAEIVLVHGSHSHRQAKVPRRPRYAQLSFRAALRGRSGELARTSGRASSREPARSGERHAIETCLVSAVEDLYEQIGRDLFVRRTAMIEVRP